MFQPATLQGSASTGYSFVFSPSVNKVSLACPSGEFWVRPKSTSTTQASSSGANTNVTSPITAPLTSGWIRMVAGAEQEFGDAKDDPISQVDVWCVADGDLLCTAH